MAEKPVHDFDWRSAKLPERVRDVITRWVERSPNHPALVEAAGTWSYQQLASSISDAKHGVLPTTNNRRALVMSAWMGTGLLAGCAVCEWLLDRVEAFASEPHENGKEWFYSDRRNDFPELEL